MTHRNFSLLTLFSLLFALDGCAEGAEGELPAVDDTPSNVTQGGPQDIGEFRRLVEAGFVPESEALDEIGFFAEHAIDLPEPDCGASVCAHPMLAVAPTFDGGNWTMGFIGMNTSLTAADLPEMPRHFIVVIEDSEAVPLPAELASVFAESLSEEDRVSVVVFSEDSVSTRIGDLPSALGSFGVTPESGNTVLVPQDQYEEELNDVADDVQSFDTYAALDRALLISRQPAFEGMAQKVLLLTSGLPQGGLTSAENLGVMGRTLAEEEVAVSVFGVGSFFGRELPRAFSEASGGNFFVSASSADLIQAIQAEAESGFWPIAQRLEILAEAAPGYRIGRIYGARSVATTETTAILSSPTLFIGARQGSQDTSGGRRGGGGGWFVELIADSAPGMTARSETPVLRVEVRYIDTLTGQAVEQDFDLLTPIGVGNNPEPEAPIFDPPISAKPFMMLNMYIALRGALSYYEQGACPLAMGMRDMMELSYVLWQEQHEDADITDDFSLLSKLTDAFVQNCSGAAAVWPVEGTTGCFYM